MNYLVSNTRVKSRPDKSSLFFLFWKRITTPSRFFGNVCQPFGHRSSNFMCFEFSGLTAIWNVSGIISCSKSTLFRCDLSMLCQQKNKEISLKFPLCSVISCIRIFKQSTLTDLVSALNLNSIAISLITKIQKTSHDNH